MHAVVHCRQQLEIQIVSVPRAEDAQLAARHTVALRDERGEVRPVRGVCLEMGQRVDVRAYLRLELGFLARLRRVAAPANGAVESCQAKSPEIAVVCWSLSPSVKSGR